MWYRDCCRILAIHLPWTALAKTTWTGHLLFHLPLNGWENGPILSSPRATLRKDPNIFVLTTDLLAKRFQPDFPFSTLGRCLLIVDDADRAEYAFQLDIAEGAEDGALEYDNTCRLCKPPSNIKGEFFVCLVCADRFLCSSCMEKYITGSAQLRGCIEHQYHKITERKWKFLTTHPRVPRMRMARVWNSGFWKPSLYIINWICRTRSQRVHRRPGLEILASKGVPSNDQFIHTAKHLPRRHLYHQSSSIWI